MAPNARLIRAVKLYSLINVALPIEPLGNEARTVLGSPLWPARVAQDTQHRVGKLRSGASNREKARQPLGHVRRTPPTSGATTGTPAAWASVSTFDAPSNRDVNKNTSMQA